MIDRKQLEDVTDAASLIRLLSDEQGLCWEIDPDEPIRYEPDLSQGVKSGIEVDVSALVQSDDSPWLILLAEFKQPYVRRDLRTLLASLRTQIRETYRFADHSGIGDTIFIVATPGYDDVRFVLFEETEKRTPSIRSFGWRREFVGRTVLTHNLDRLYWIDRTSWHKAWDVEGLTDEFYDHFIKVFDAVMEATTHPGSAADKHAYVQQLLDRLLFIAFIERMGWLLTPDGSTDYLHTQWLRFNQPGRYAEVKDKTIIPATFNGFLGWLFFRALDNPNGVKRGDRFYPILGEVPYLNGGLFTEEADLDVSGVTVSEEAFDLILGDKRRGFDAGLFRRFNFTVTESTPLDQEVAVDPEMLGKIFERLITKEERHKEGAYYTPRPIVLFMVNEAVKGYLTERGLSAEKASLLVDQNKVELDELVMRASEMQDAMDWLFEIRAVDPACGSGAYLLMLLHRLFELIDRLEVVRDKKRNPDRQHDYENKLHLLERCIYGVDVNPIAVRIARLRLWLSLVVENRGAKPDPLPNFDFLIMCGDSLASPVKPNEHTLGYPHDAIREYTRLKHRYFHPNDGEERPTRAEMRSKRAEIAEALKDELASGTLRSVAKNPFDWEVDFAEVFDPTESTDTLAGRLNLGPAGGWHGQGELAANSSRPPGFDIVLANPPYVNAGELLRSVGKDYKQALVTEFPQTSSGTADLLVFFMARGLQLLQPHGHMAFITSNKWLKATYGLKLRVQIANKSRLLQIVNFGELRVFQNVAMDALITIISNGTAGDTTYTQVPNLDSPYPDLAEVCSVNRIDLPPDAIGKDGAWLLVSGKQAARHRRMSQFSRPLGEIFPNDIKWGIKTGMNEVFVDSNGRQWGQKEKGRPANAVRTGVFVLSKREKENLVRLDSRSAEILVPLLTGDDIRRWRSAPASRWLILTRIGTDITRYTAIRAHLEAHSQKLRARSDKGPNYWELRSCTYYSMFLTRRIVYPEISISGKFAIAEPGIYTNNKVFMLASDDEFLLSVLNSSPAWEALTIICSALGDPADGGRLELRTDYLKRLPIPEASDADKQALRAISRDILGAIEADPTADVSGLESEIDRRVEFLYFHAGEGATYDEWRAKREAEKGTVIEEVRKLIAIGHETDTHEYKSSFAWDVRKNERADFLRDEVHTAICAFLNAAGGEVLVGVDDDGNILGLQNDLTRYGSKDKLVQAVESVFGNTLTPNPIGLVNIRFVEIDGQTICRVRVQGDNSNIYKFKDNIYARRNSGSKPALTAEDAAPLVAPKAEGVGVGHIVLQPCPRQTLQTRQ